MEESAERSKGLRKEEMGAKSVRLSKTKQHSPTRRFITPLPHTKRGHSCLCDSEILLSLPLFFPSANCC